MSKEVEIKASEQAQELVEVFKKAFPVEVDETILTNMFMKAYMEGAAFKPKKGKDAHRKWRFGNIVLVHEMTTKLDYYRITDLVNDWSIRVRQDAPLYQWIDINVSDPKKHEYFSHMFLIFFALTHSWQATPDGMNEIARAYNEDVLRWNDTLRCSEEEDAKILKEEKDDYNFQHEVHKPKEEKNG